MVLFYKVLLYNKYKVEKVIHSREKQRGGDGSMVIVPAWCPEVRIPEFEPRPSLHANNIQSSRSGLILS